MKFYKRNAMFSKETKITGTSIRWEIPILVIVVIHDTMILSENTWSWNISLQIEHQPAEFCGYKKGRYNKVIVLMCGE